ncbi:M23 family metallopeptidase [Streptomyces sp. P38-E01]|uniref:M23 family metallopeptidase n=1 Tax=Streptomyces tardus TaxID=2780544 RepID=A0A949JEX7_9ACTN|nr:M23 family metallopeptidase [Streptomyces tardus]MBU7598197.1 M23 family metallopeptidase [Streptomyces tardus]
MHFPRVLRGNSVRRRVLAAGVAAGCAALTLTAAGPASAAEPAAFVAACPAAGVISQGHHSGHDGVDIANELGTPLHAAGPGEVTHSGEASGYGQWIRILHPDGAVTEYGHMYERFVQVGDQVQAGQHIASMGSEGQSTGPHLHFEVHLDGGFGFGEDPVPYLGDRGVPLPCTP